MIRRLRIARQRDFAAGVLYILAGSAFAIGALSYKIGDAARMGPGWFPLAIGGLLAAVGLFTAVGSLGAAPQRSERLEPPQWRSIAWILGAVVLFGLLLQPAGLVVALAVLVIVSSMGSHEFTWKAALVNTVVLIAFSIAVFIEGIELQIGLWPTFLR